MNYLIVIFLIMWAVVYYSAWLIYKQKMGPYYKKLPQLRNNHENAGFLWVLLFLLNLWLKPSVFGFLVPSSILVVLTGLNLKRNKPTAVFVHVSLVLLTTMIALVLGVNSLAVKF